MNFRNYLSELGLIKEVYIAGGEQHSHLSVMVHSSYRNIRGVFFLAIDDIIDELTDIITPAGSIVFPTFTYCFKYRNAEYEVFNRDRSPSKVGAISEAFRRRQDVVRTSSPTHSFALWGNCKNDISISNNPLSPLGEGSVCSWFYDKAKSENNSFVLLLGCGFESLTMLHYFELFFNLPYIDINPWEYMGVLPYGVSVDSITELKHIPGCSKSFKNFEAYLNKRGLIKFVNYNGLSSSLINVHLLAEWFFEFIGADNYGLLCQSRACKPCAALRHLLINNISLTDIG